MKTENRATAFRAAKEWYDELLSNSVKVNRWFKSPNFKTVSG